MPGRTDRADDASFRVAHAVSMTINPIVLVPVFFALVLASRGWPAPAVLSAVGIATFFMSAIPLALLVWMVRTGRAATIEVRVRTRRAGPFLVAFLGGVAALVFSLALEWPSGPLFEPLIGCFVANAALLAGVNSRFKISLHSAGIAGFTSMGGWLAWTAGDGLMWALVALPLVPLVMWARVHSSAHSKAEVLAGAAYGLVVPVLELALLARLGWLTVS